ncbi:MAG: ABC transporter permease [Bdellovibrio sp.]|nr:ABC transporter permease [Bdellovibrio sp.]
MSEWIECPIPVHEKLLKRIGAPVYEQVCTTYEGFVLFFRLLQLLPQINTWRWREIWKAIAQIGVGSIPIICVSTAFAGLVITQEIAWHMDKALHTVSMIPGFTAQFILRELGIAIPALLLVSKVGAATTAEVGSMKITEQIDALRLLKIDPIRYLAFPKFLAAMISGACLTLIATAVTLGCALSVAVLRFNFSVLEYLNALRHFIGPKDLICALVKGTLYGGVIPVISCAYGFRCKGGAEGVGNATTHSVVASTVVVILLDFLLTYIFTWVL